MKYLCRLCGKEDDTESWLESTRMAVEKLCFNCNFWDKLVVIKDDPKTVRVKGTHYIIGPEPKNERALFLGFGGRRFDIRFKDGREVSTRNLWCQGEIDHKFREQLPDNAEFIE